MRASVHAIGVTNVASLLTNKGAVEEVSAKLRKQNFSVGANTDTSFAWNLLEQQTWQTFLVSAIFVVCSAMLTREKIVQEKRSAGGEYAVLLTAGLLTCKVEKIIPLRILIMESILMCGTLGITVVIGSFSMLAIIPGFVLILLHYGISCSKLSGRDSA